MEPFVFPQFDKIAFALGPFAIRWYALAYIFGLVLGWWFCISLTRRPPFVVKQVEIDDLFVWVTLGVLIGGRLGFVLLYQPGYYAENIIEVFQPWKGGMAFHGGLIGVIAAVYLYARKNSKDFWPLADLLAAATPIGLFLGRIGNFINGELWGRVTVLPWGMIFPEAGNEARHPSQLYQAGLEGLVLFIILIFLIFRRDALCRPGLIGGTFLAGYGVLRSVGEIFREQTHFVDQIPLGITWGQLLSSIMFLLGSLIVIRSLRQPPIGVNKVLGKN